MKKLFSLIGALAVLDLLLSITNTAPNSVDEKVAMIEDIPFKEASTILFNKCKDCHSSRGKMPFYAKFPIAKKLIAADMIQGMERLNMDGKLENNGVPFSELDLARLEGVLYADNMAPYPYRIMHWNSGLSQPEKDSIKKWIYQTRRERRAQEGFVGMRAGEPIPPLPKAVQLDSQKVALGKIMFHDRRLSGDETISCANCHSLKKGGSDQAVTSTGIRGQIGTINAPTVFNAVYNHRQFWDGRAADLEEQAGGPVTNPVEMGGDWDIILANLEKDEQLISSFTSAYQDGLTKKNILNAIATFEQSLITPNSRFDNFLRGDENALSAHEKKGYELFKTNCISCHAGPNLGGLSFEKLGVKKDYFATRKRSPNEADMGLFNFTKNDGDKYKFKVPSLRNIALTHPYLHDGSANSLEETVSLMAKHQIGKNFTTTQVDQLARFLETLTGEYEGKLLE